MITVYLDREADAQLISEYESAYDYQTPVQVGGISYLVVAFDLYSGKRTETEEGVCYKLGGMTYEFRLYPA
jgi:hypothetical protein